MKLIKQGQGEVYEAKGQFGYWSMRKLAAAQDSQRLTVSLTHFLPGGGTDMSGSPNEKIYYVLSVSGIIVGDDQELQAKEGLTFYVSGEPVHGMRNRGNESLVVLFITVYI